MNPIHLVFQNKDLVVVDKPALTLSVPARFASDERPVLGRILEQQLQQKIYPVHRLDFEVSGVIIFALNSRAHQILNRGFERRKIHKVYTALTGGSNTLQVPQGEQVWKRKILRGKKRSYESPHGELAETKARVVDAREDQIQWDLSPITGKPHQLRLELYLQGFPILGDQLYNSQKSWSKPGIALRAKAIYFPEEMQSQFDIPSKFEVNLWT